MLLQITLHSACFAIEVGKDWTVTDTAPIAKWARGKDFVPVLDYFIKRGAKVEILST